MSSQSDLGLFSKLTMRTHFENWYCMVRDHPLMVAEVEGTEPQAAMEEEDGAEGGGGRAGKVLVLKVLGFGIPALDALQEVLPVLRVLAGGEAGADLGGTEEVLHFSVRRPPPPPLDNMVDVQSARSQHRGPSSSLQRSAMRRPAPIDTSQYAYRSPSERSGGERGSHGRGQPRQTSPRRSGCRSPDARSLAPSPVVLPIGRTDSRDSMPSASNPFGTLDLIWQEIFLTGLDQETLASRSGLQLVVECRDPRDRSLLSSTPQISLDTLIVHRPGLQRREVLLTPHVPHNGGMRDVSWEVLEEGTVDGREPCPSKFNLSGRGMGCVSGKVDEGMHISVGALGGGGQLEMEGRVLDAHDAARRAVAFRLARETRLFDKHLDEQDAWGDTPLLRACRERKLVRTRTLLAAGADVSICNHEVGVPGLCACATLLCPLARSWCCLPSPTPRPTDPVGRVTYIYTYIYVHILYMCWGTCGCVGF